MAGRITGYMVELLRVRPYIYVTTRSLCKTALVRFPEIGGLRLAITKTVPRIALLAAPCGLAS